MARKVASSIAIRSIGSVCAQRSVELARQRRFGVGQLAEELGGNGEEIAASQLALLADAGYAVAPCADPGSLIRAAERGALPDAAVIDDSLLAQGVAEGWLEQCSARIRSLASRCRARSRARGRSSTACWPWPSGSGDRPRGPPRLCDDRGSCGRSSA
jgi:hypothetical protein